MDYIGNPYILNGFDSELVNWSYFVGPTTAGKPAVVGPENH